MKFTDIIESTNLSTKQRLAKLEAEYASMPKRPATQAGYDALDDIRQQISELKGELNQNVSEAVEPNVAAQAEKSVLQINAAIGTIQAQVAKYQRLHEENPTNRSIVDVLDFFAEELSNLAMSA